MTIPLGDGTAKAPDTVGPCAGEARAEASPAPGADGAVSTPHDPASPPAPDRVPPPGRPALDMHFAGVLLLLAFFLPVRGEAGWRFPNITELGGGGFTQTFFIGFPLAAGLLLLALSRARRPGWQRGALLVGLGLLPFAILLSFPPFLEEMVVFIAYLMPANPMGSLLRLVAGFLGFSALYAGLRGTVFRPEARPFRLLALGGALLMLGMLFLPCRVPNTYSWGEPVSLPEIAVPFYLVVKCRGFDAWVIVAGKVAGLALFLFCLCRAFGLNLGRPSPAPRRDAVQGLVALWTSYLAETVPLLLVILFQAPDEGFYMAAGLFKVLVWTAGLALILPVGLVDWQLGTLPPAGGAPVPSPPGQPDRPEAAAVAGPGETAAET